MHPGTRHAHAATVYNSGIQAHSLVSCGWEAGEVPIGLGARPAFANINKGDEKPWSSSH